LKPSNAKKSGASIVETKLENGLTVLVAERHFDPVVAVMLWYRCGARDEGEREAGVAHFLEHMMFKGSRRFGKGEVDLATTRLGGSNNAFTSADHTAYWFELASDRWEKALEIESDRMRGLLLDPAEFEAEKAVVLEELSMGEDDPWRVLVQQVQQALFGRHAYHRPVIGYVDTLKALTVDDMRAWYERHYHPANATLVVCGDTTVEAALAAARKHFGAIPAGPAKASAWSAPAPAPRGEQRLSMEWDDDGKRVCIAWPTTKVGEDDDYALDVLATALSSGRNSRLHRLLVLEEGLATSVSTHNDTRVDGGAFWLYAQCAHGIEPQKLERALLAEVQRAREALLEPAELLRAKQIIEAGEAHDSETVSDLAEELGEYAVDAHWILAVEAVERIKAIDAAAVREAARRYLGDERRVVGWSLPKRAPEAKGARGAKSGAGKSKSATRRAASAKSIAPKKKSAGGKARGKKARRAAARSRRAGARRRSEGTVRR
jgi:zinc protease